MVPFRLELPILNDNGKEREMPINQEKGLHTDLMRIVDWCIFR
jgi:hypothetical protein